MFKWILKNFKINKIDRCFYIKNIKTLIMNNKIYLTKTLLFSVLYQNTKIVCVEIFLPTDPDFLKFFYEL